MNEDKILQKLGEHDKRFDALESDFGEFKIKTLATQDEMVTILRRLDEERLFTTRWVDRIEKEVERHEQELSEVKKHLKIS